MAIENKLLRTGVVLMATSSMMGVLGCGAKSLPNIEACSEPQQLPTKGNVDSVYDPRSSVRACDYLNDLDIPYNQPVEIRKINEAILSDRTFIQKASLGGWAILGSGTLHGEASTLDETIQRDSYAVFMGQRTPGLYRKLIVDASKVSLGSCGVVCDPSIEIRLSNQILFKKDSKNGDGSSIWASNSPSDEITSGEWRRYNTVASVSYLLPREKTVDSVYRHGSITGGPMDPGSVVSNLASSIIIRLPEKELDQALANPVVSK